MIHDPSAILLCAKNPETGVFYFYREYYEKDKVLAEVALNFKKMMADIPQGCLHMPLIDPSADKRSKTTGRTYKQQLQIEYGVVTKKAINNIEDGLQKVKNMMFAGKLMFFNSLKETLREGCEYRYPTQEERSKNKNLGEKPLDKDNHLMDCLRYICQDVPYNYMEMRNMAFSNYVRFFEEQKRGIRADKPLSFRDMLDIITTDNINDDTDINSEYAGGYVL